MFANIKMQGVPLVGRAYRLEVREIGLHNLIAAGSAALGEVSGDICQGLGVHRIHDRAGEFFRAVGAVGVPAFFVRACVRTRPARPP